MAKHVAEAPADGHQLVDRPFRSDIPGPIFDRIQDGVVRTVYRNLAFSKSPFDIAIYLQLLSRLRPRTVIEIGTKAGGSTLWFADMMTAQGAESPAVISVDIRPCVTFTDPRIAFLKGDAKALAEVLTDQLMSQLGRPLLVVEDSSHMYTECMPVLSFFHPHLSSGDYIVVEDGIVSQLTDPAYLNYKDGPNRAVADFLARQGDDYEIDSALCDLYGHNVTYNPNGWLRRR